MGAVILMIATAGAHAGSGPDRCVAPAAQHHGVNPSVLRAILAIESGTRADVISRNKNGSIDVGIAGINSIHFRDLAKVGITPDKLMDPCVSTYVAAWKLSKHMARFGNNWYGVAAYHSKTPYFNARYQILLHNQLVRQGAIAGKKLRVPPLQRSVQSTTPRLKPGA